MLSLRRVLLGVLLIAEGVLLSITVQHGFDDRLILRWESIALAVFLVVLPLSVSCSLTGRAGARFIVGVGAAFEVIALTRQPIDSDDDFRYMWDGKVQLAGIDPYRYAPSSPALAHLRTNFLFPGGACPHPISGGCTRINLPDQHTIYPPVAEAIFTLLRLLSFGAHHLPLQLAAALGTLAISCLLARRAFAQDLPLWPVAMWAWCPVTIIEFANNAHIDWLANLLSVLALTCYTGRRFGWAGVLVGAAVATKLYPALVGAGMLRRRPVLVVGAAVATVVLVYIPHVAVVGRAVVGYLPTYLSAGGYGTGQQYHLISWLPSGLVTPAAIVILLAAVVWAVWRSDPARPEAGALLVVGAAVLVGTPVLPWYTLLLLALVALNARPEWLGVVIAPSIEYLAVGDGANRDSITTTVYAIALGVLVAGTAARWLTPIMMLRSRRQVEQLAA